MNSIKGIIIRQDSNLGHYHKYDNICIRVINVMCYLNSTISANVKEFVLLQLMKPFS